MAENEDYYNRNDTYGSKGRQQYLKRLSTSLS